MTKLENELFEALREAVGWNWLDEYDPPPPEVLKKVADALEEFDRQQQTEQPKEQY